MGLEQEVEVRHLQQLLDRLRDVAQFQVPVRFPSGGEQTDHSAETAAVDECNVAEMQDEVLAVLHHSADMGAQGIGFAACDDASTALDNRDRAYASRIECKRHFVPLPAMNAYSDAGDPNSDF